MENYQTIVNYNYIDELKRKFTNVTFKCIDKYDGLYITNPDNRSASNDIRITSELQVKKILRSFCAPFVSKVVKKKLSYFSQGEDDDKNIYKLDKVQCLQPDEKYAVQNVGHATQLIQIPGFNILTDPVYGDLNSILFPSKTESHPNIESLPPIDVIIISHNHRDHVNQESLQKLVKQYKTNSWPQPKILVPLGDKELFEHFGFKQATELEWYTKVSISKDIDRTTKTVNFISIAADHRSGRYGYDNHRSLVSGWIINPEQDDVIFKYSGDTRALTDENQIATDAVLLNEINSKMVRDGNSSRTNIPDIVCLEPSGPNYTRQDMDVTHQSTSYSALLKFKEAKNLAKLSGINYLLFLQKMQTVILHHNKYELGPDRFNEGLFIMKKLLKYLDLSEKELNHELKWQDEKLEQDLDKKKLRAMTPFTSRPILSILPKQTSLLVRSKGFIIRELTEIINRGFDKTQIKEFLMKNTTFPKIGERLNSVQLANSTFDPDYIRKYCGQCKKSI